MGSLELRLLTLSSLLFSYTISQKSSSYPCCCYFLRATFMITFLPHGNFRIQALLALFQMGKVPIVMQLVSGRGRTSPVSSGPRAHVPPSCHITFLEQQDVQCKECGEKDVNARNAFFLLSQGEPFSAPAASQSLLLFCPLSFSLRPALLRAPEAHCLNFPVSGNSLHFHSSRKFCLWKFLTMIFNGNIRNSLNVLNIQHKAI